MLNSDSLMNSVQFVKEVFFAAAAVFSEQLHQRFGLKTSSAATSDRSSRGVGMANPDLVRIRSLGKTPWLKD